MSSGAHERIVSGEAGAWAWPLRAALRVAESAYALCMRRRNARFDRDGPACRLDVPVISVGNLTVGGTGKTPLVIELVRRLQAMGRRPAVLARGYRAGPGEPNDEELVIRRGCPGLLYFADADRVRAGRLAVERFAADVIVLDDGFQHRRLGRALDIVLVDATAPFGHEHLLPRGWLREPVSSLTRADVVVITRCDQASSELVQAVRRRVSTFVDPSRCLRCRHAVTRIERLDGTAADVDLRGRRVVLFAGIARPASLVASVQRLGATVVGTRWWPDHHRYTPRDVGRLTLGDGLAAHDALVTTEKDAVKLSGMAGVDLSDVLVVKVAIDFVDEDAKMLQAVLEETLGRGA